jgi:hypothetical protein
MSPHLQEESLVDRETDSSALTLDTCSAWMAAPAVARSWVAHRAARKVYRLEFSGENFSEFALSYLLVLYACSFTLVLCTWRPKKGGAQLSE